MKTTNETGLQESTRKEESVMEKRRCSINESIRPFYEEPTYDDFLSREQFIAATGVFITQDYYQYIHRDFLDSGKALDEFISSYVETYKDELYTTDGSSITIHLKDLGMHDIWPLMDKDPNMIDFLFAATNRIYHLEETLKQTTKLLEQGVEVTNEMLELLNELSLAQLPPRWYLYFENLD